MLPGVTQLGLFASGNDLLLEGPWQHQARPLPRALLAHAPAP